MPDRVTVHGRKLTDQTVLSVRTCPVCGIRYALPQELLDIKDRDGESWYCPNGHSLHFVTPKAVRLEEELAAERARLAAERARLDQARAQAAHERAKREATQRALTATKGHLTRAKRRAAAALCPVPGCKRQIVQMDRHLRTVHRDWVDAHVHVEPGGADGQD